MQYQPFSVIPTLLGSDLVFWVFCTVELMPLLRVQCKPGWVTLSHPQPYRRVILSYLLTYDELVTS
jgi:hypothetical protein